MGKHGKSKTNGGSKSPRPVPYEKPKVEVSYDGAPSVPTKAPATKSQSQSSKPKPAQPKLPNTNIKSKGKAKAITPEVEAPAEAVVPDSPTFKIIIGTYEKLLYGLEGSYPPGATTPTLKPIFIFPAHLACVRAVAASPGGKWLATGSEDEFVKVWDLRRRKEVGSLSQHTGSITSLHFPTASHLITTSEDSTLSLFRTSDWTLLKSLKGHSGRVNNVDVHPTGRVALTVGKDQTLKMWDLMRGRGAASLGLGSEAELVKFSPLGTHFAVLFPKKIQIYSLTLKLLHTLTTTSRFNTLLFALLPSGKGDEEKEVLCVGTEKGIVEVYDVTLEERKEPKEGDEDEEDEEEDEDEGGSGAQVEKVATLVGHSNRIKSISSLPFYIPAIDSTSLPKKTVLLTSASSDGLINVYDLSTMSEATEKVVGYDTKGSRLTCVSMADGGVSRKAAKVDSKAVAKGGRKVVLPAESEDEEEEEEEEEDEEEEGDIYENGGEEEGEEEEDEDEMEVEFEDEEEDEGEYE
ncbi:protein MAK11, partial [Tremellales sp. Uapishka_1]